MLPKIKTYPDLSENSPKHIKIKDAGKDFFFQSQNFNVIDKFKSFTADQIREELEKTSFPYAVCLENWTGNFNFSSCIRNANAFNAREIFYVGNKKFDKRGMVGVQNYKSIQFLKTIGDLKVLKNKYRFIGIDNIPGAILLKNYKRRWYYDCIGDRWDKMPMIIFGEEGCGLTPGMIELCEDIVMIEQFGSVRSLNCATASGILMHEIVSSGAI